MNKLEEHLLGFVEAKMDLAKIDIKLDFAKIFSRIILWSAVLLVLSILLLFFSISIALYLNDYMGSSVSGFVVLSVFYLIVLMVLILSFKTFGLHDRLTLYILSLVE